MAAVLIAFKLLWKRKLANFTVIVQILLSIIMLAQLFVTIQDYLDNLHAVNELPVHNALVVSLFYYYDQEYVAKQILRSPEVDSVGSVYMSESASCNNIPCNLAAYNDGIIAHYAPGLESGSWLSHCASDGGKTFPAVVSGDMGLKVGGIADIGLPDGKTCRISVAGVLKEPTQYLFPTNSASPEYFSAKAVISQRPVIIVRDTDLGGPSALASQSDTAIVKNIFVFLKPDADEAKMDTAGLGWKKYGEVTPMISLVSTFNKNTNTMIGGTTIMFLVFLSLALMGVLSNNVIQSLRNRRQFTVYYLLGMNWKKVAAVEACRVGILIVITMLLTLALGKTGLLMLNWMTPARTFLFFGTVFLYLVVMFCAVGAGFVIKLMREDLSEALKELQQGE